MRDATKLDRTIRAAQEAARALELSRSWLSESVTMYTRRLEQEGDRIFIGIYPTPERVGLRVVAAKPTYILAMKLNALERSTADDRDFQDAAALGAACGATTEEALRGGRRQRTDAGEQIEHGRRGRCPSSVLRLPSSWIGRPQTLADVSRRARVRNADFALALDELVDEFYLDHPDKAAQQKRLDPVPEPVGGARIDA